MLPDGIDCNDNDHCTYSDQCKSGMCIGFMVVCNDQDPCTMDRCDPSVGCVHDLIEENCGDSGSPISPELTTPAPTPAAEFQLAAPLAIPPAPPPPNNDGVLSQVIDTYDEGIEQAQDNNNDEVAEGESNNQVIAQSSISFGAGLIGLGLVSCAGCLAMFFGVLAAKDIEKEGEVDRLDTLLDAEEEILGTTIESDAFVAPE